MDSPPQDHKQTALHEFAESRPRDQHGHFIHSFPQESPTNQNTSQNPANTQTSRPLLNHLIPHGIEVDHHTTSDDLLDVHLGNPLRRITALLEEIKKQKAFSFTLKGSLGLAGVAIVLGTFGFFGGTHILCSKGVQSEMGTLKMLDYTDTPQRVPVISTLTDILNAAQGKSTRSKETNRIVLIRQDGTLLHIQGVESISLNKLTSSQVILTGEYDSCSNTVSLNNSSSIQTY